MATPGQATRRAGESASQLMTGAELRALRLERELSQQTFGGLLGLPHYRVSAIEKRQVVPAIIAAQARALSRAGKAGQLKTPTSPRLKPWRESPRFSQKPPFESLPGNGIACRCGRSTCRLIPQRDGDWLNGHLWMFHGSNCYRHVFLNSSGVKVMPVRERRWRESKLFKQKPPFDKLPPACPICSSTTCRPRTVRDAERDGEHFWVFSGYQCQKSYWLDARGKFVGTLGNLRYPGDAAPHEQCSKCGRSRALGKKFSVRLGCDVYTRYCRRHKGDAKDQQHDAPSHYFKLNGKFVPLTAQELLRLHYRGKRAFVVVQCELDGCPRHGRAMERYSTVRGWLDGTLVFLAVVRCRASKPHVSYRMLPNGEIAERLGMGKYRWTDSATGQIREIVPARRPLRKNRIMPAASCPTHGRLLQQYSGPWPVRRKMRRWRAVCSVGREFWYVRSDGDVRPVKTSRWLGRGRRRGQKGEGTDRRIILAAALLYLGYSQSKMVPHLYPRQEDKETGRKTVQRFLKRNAEAIEHEKKDMTAEHANAIIQAGFN